MVHSLRRYPLDAQRIHVRVVVGLGHRRRREVLLRHTAVLGVAVADDEVDLRDQGDTHGLSTA